jgi:predicted DNA-binding protein with PD1-like motif
MGRSAWSKRRGGPRGGIPFLPPAPLFRQTALPEPMQAVSDGARWMVRMVEGERLPDAFVEFARSQGIRAAAVPMGIGQLTQVRLAFWNGSEYVPRDLTSPVELVSLSGSIADADGEPSVHLHATVGLADHSAAGGHLVSGTVGLLVESLIVTFPGQVFRRPFDESVGLRRLELGRTG